MNKKVLVVEDDSNTSHLIQAYLQKSGYRVAAAHDGKQALETARRMLPDLVVLDLMLPEIDGMEVCRRLKATYKVPVIMLTARATEEDKLLGLDVGADDYVTKPFSPRELVARVRAVLRRTDDAEDQDLRDLSFGDITISFLRHEVVAHGRLTNLTPTEFRILELLARNPGRVFTRSQLVDQVIGLEFEGIERTVDVHVMNLRRKIEVNASRPRYIRTVYGVGYKFEAGEDVQ